MTEPAFRILTVCVGNLCRSPLAERLLRARLDAVGPDARVIVESAGVAAAVAAPMDPAAAAELARLGGDPDDFVARRLTADLLDTADLVLAATRDVRRLTLQEQPRAMRRTFTLLEFAAICRAAPADPEGVTDPRSFVGYAGAHRGLAGVVEQDLPDPIGRSADVHRQVADRMDDAVDAVLARLAPLLSP